VIEFAPNHWEDPPDESNSLADFLRFGESTPHLWGNDRLQVQFLQLLVENLGGFA
jgi:hypothetical protein